MPRALQPANVRVHGLPQACAVLAAARAAGRPVRLIVGVAWGWAACAALRDLAEAAEPGAPADWAFDPGGRAGAAALALRQGAPTVLWPRGDGRRAALAAQAAATGGRLLAPPRRLLDLAGSEDPLRAAQAR